MSLTGSGASVSFLSASRPARKIPVPAPHGQATVDTREIALVPDRIRSKDGPKEPLAQCTMGGNRATSRPCVPPTARARAAIGTRLACYHLCLAGS